MGLYDTVKKTGNQRWYGVETIIVAIVSLKIAAFRTGEKASILDGNQKSLMDRQAEAMNTYSKVLAERINYEIKKTKEAL